MNPNEPLYIGDGIHVYFEDGSIVLITGDTDEPDDKIYIDGPRWDDIQSWVAKHLNVKPWMLELKATP